MTNILELKFDKAGTVNLLSTSQYSDPVALISELVNNAYDADATEVYIEYSEKSITVRDNGSGMNKSELESYLIIGNSPKKKNKRSPKFDRQIIGTFGIGKLAPFALAKKFKLITTKDNIEIETVISLEKIESDDLKFRFNNREIEQPNGTTVVIFELNKVSPLDDSQIVRHLRSKVPLSAPNFAVYLNNEKIAKEVIRGQSRKISEETSFGPVEGEIIIADKPLRLKDAGVECQINNVTVTKDLFGYEGAGHGINRITGFVNANFLTCTSSRDSFLTSTEQYETFYELMRGKVGSVMGELKKGEDEQESAERIKRLRAANKQVSKALRKNPQIISQTSVLISPNAKRSDYTDEVKALANYTFTKTQLELTKPTHQKGDPKEKIRTSIDSANVDRRKKITKRVDTNFGVSTELVMSGEEGPISYFEEGTIYINQEHKLYAYFEKKSEQFEVDHLIRIIFAEIALQSEPENSQNFLDIQQKLLLDSYL